MTAVAKKIKEEENKQEADKFKAEEEAYYELLDQAEAKRQNDTGGVSGVGESDGVLLQSGDDNE